MLQPLDTGVNGNPQGSEGGASRPTGLINVCLLALFLLAPAASAQENKQAGPRPLPGDGVADAAGKMGFFPNTTGGIDALDLATGNVVWSTKAAEKPLIAAEGRLFAVKGKNNKLWVVALDIGDEGKRLFESPAIALPEWASVDAVYGRTFRSGVRFDKGSLFLIWEARAFYAGGAAPPPEVERAARKQASGVARIDVDSGKVEPLAADAVTSGRFFPLQVVAASPRVGTLALQIQDAPAKNAKNPFAQRRTLQALKDGKEVVWQRDIAAPVFLPPPP